MTSATVSRTTLEVLRTRIEAGFDELGLVHTLLDAWGRLDRNGRSGGGRLCRSWPLRLDDLDDEAILSIGGIGMMALPLAHAEAQLYFSRAGTVTSAAVGDELNRAVRASIGRCLGRAV